MSTTYHADENYTLYNQWNELVDVVKDLMQNLINDAVIQVYYAYIPMWHNEKLPIDKAVGFNLSPFMFTVADMVQPYDVTINFSIFCRHDADDTVMNIASEIIDEFVNNETTRYYDWYATRCELTYIFHEDEFEPSIRIGTLQINVSSQMVPASYIEA